MSFNKPDYYDSLQKFGTIYRYPKGRENRKNGIRPITNYYPKELSASSNRVGVARGIN